MLTPICKQLGLGFPIFAFSHCRDVVVAVSKAGGIGIYGGALSSAEQVEIDIRWIEEQLKDLPYGVDLMLPKKYIETKESEIQAHLPEQHRRFLDGIMERYGVPELSSEGGDVGGLLGDAKFTPEQNAAILNVIFKYNPKIFVSALGTPPADVIERCHAKGMLVGALAGKAKHAINHKKAGVDVIIAASIEAGGHTGELGSMVLIPEVVDAVAPTPVLAAGGIGRGRQMVAAMALGAQGVWCGSVWLTSTESDVLPLVKEKLLAAESDQTSRSRCFTGKHARFLKTAWTDEWDNPESPDPLHVPMHTALIGDSIKRISAAVASGKTDAEHGAGALISTPVGQIVGHMNCEVSSREIVREMVEEFAGTVMNLSTLFDEE